MKVNYSILILSKEEGATVNIKAKDIVDIVPFIKIIDLHDVKNRYKSEYENKLHNVISELERQGTSQIILRNWSKVSEEDFLRAYHFIKDVCIKCSLMLEAGSLKSLDKLICNIYKVYQESSIEEEIIMKQYFIKRGIRIWRLIDLRYEDNIDFENIFKANEMLFKDDIYEKVIIRISSRANINDIFQCQKFISYYEREKLILFPYVKETNRYILDMEEFSV